MNIYLKAALTSTFVLAPFVVLWGMACFAELEFINPLGSKLGRFAVSGVAVIYIMTFLFNGAALEQKTNGETAGET